MKFMHAITVGYLIGFAPWSLALGSDEWLGLNSRDYSLELAMTLQDGDNDLQRISFSSPALMSSEIRLAYADFTVESANSESQLASYSLGWQSDPGAAFSINLDYSYTGKANVVEITEFGFGLTHVLALDCCLVDPYYGVSVYDGEIRGFSRERISDLFSIPDSAKINRSGIGGFFGLLNQGWGVQVFVRQHDYSRDLSDILTSRLFLLAFDEVVAGQMLILTNWDVGLNFSRYVGVWDFTLGWEQYENVLTEDSERSFSSGIEYSFANGLSLGADMLFLQEESIAELELSLGYNW